MVKRIERVVAYVEDFVACVALAVFSIAILVGVLFRYVFNAPLSWPNEFSLITFAWLMFLGAAICAREDSHVLIDLILPKNGSLVYKWTEALAASVALLISLVMAWVSYKYTLGAYTMVTPVFRISSAVYNAAAPVGFILIAGHMCTALVRILRGQMN